MAKKGLLAILAPDAEEEAPKSSKVAADEGDEEEDEAPSEEELDAAKQLLNAMKGTDPAKLVTAWRNMSACCGEM